MLLIINPRAVNLHKVMTGPILTKNLKITEYLLEVYFSLIKDRYNGVD